MLVFSVDSRSFVYEPAGSNAHRQCVEPPLLSRLPPFADSCVLVCDQLFIVSDADDPDLEEVVDFRIGSSRGHRLLPAVAEVSRLCAIVREGTSWVPAPGFLM